MLKLEQTIHPNSTFLAICLCLLGFTTICQTKDNQIKQNQSPNSNAQIGDGNVIKSETVNKNDNRKYYNKTENTKVENNSYSMPLITGDNPFVIINNVMPNKDSVNYEIQVKKKTIRITLASFMVEGYNLKTKCLSDTNYTELSGKIINWSSRTYEYIKTVLDLGYAAQFALAETNDGLSYSSNERANQLNNYIRARLSKLDHFIVSLY